MYTIPLVLVSILLLTVLLLATSSEADNQYPGSGNWNVYEDTTVSNKRITVTGSITVHTGAKLTLNTVDLLISGTNGQRSIQIRQNGELDFNGGSIKAVNSDNHYKFRIDSNAKADLEGVVISDLWQDSTKVGANLDGGIYIRSSQVTINECRLTHNDRIAITIKECSPKIINCTIDNSSYHSYYRYKGPYYWDSDIWRDAYGIAVLSGAPEISGCTLQDLGDYTTAYNDYFPDRDRIYLQLNAKPIYVANGAPKIRDCTFMMNGKIHDQGYHYVRIGNRYVYFYHYQEGVRACVYTDNAVMLEVSGCTFKGNWLGEYRYSRNAYQVYLANGQGVVKDTVINETNGGGVLVSGATIIIEDSQFINYRYYGVQLTNDGDYTIRDMVFNGTGDKRPPRDEQAIYFNRVEGDIEVTRLNISFVTRAFYIYNVPYIKITNCIITNTTKKVYANAAHVDLINVTIAHGEIELGYEMTEVNIKFRLDVLVTWQNGLPIEGAVVQIFNDSKGLIRAEQTLHNGMLPTLMMLQSRKSGTSRDSTSTVNTPLRISAYANGTVSDLYEVKFERNTYYQCIVHDRLPPNVLIYYPETDHAQNSRTLTIYGVAVDVGSGLLGVEVSSDGENWMRAWGGLTWNITLELEEGIYDIRVKGLDVGGSNSVTIIGNVTIDLTAPELSVTEPKSTFVYTNQTTITIIGNAEIGSRVFINGEELTVSGGQFFTQLTDQAEGLNTYEVAAVDHVGNRNITMLRIYRDSTNPILLVEHPSEDFVTNERVLEISGLTEIDVAVTINEVPVAVENGLFTLSMTMEEGSNRIVIEAVDLAKNHKQLVRTVVYDVTPPEVNMEYPVRDEAVRHSNIEVKAVVDIDVAQVRINLVPVLVADGTFKKKFKLDEGPNVIEIEVTDRAGNSVTLEYTLILDTVAPELVLESPADGERITEPTVTITGHAEVGATITVNDDAVEVTGGYFRHEAELEETAPGGDPNELVVRATDAVGNEAELVIHLVRDTIAPTLQVYDVKGSTEDDFINITGKVREVPDVESVSINGIPVQPDENGYFAAYVPLDLGENTFLVLAVDHAGNEATATVEVERVRMTVKDSGALGLGDSSWILLLLFLMVGIAVAFGILNYLERREVSN